MYVNRYGLRKWNGLAKRLHRSANYPDALGDTIIKSWEAAGEPLQSQPVVSKRPRKTSGKANKRQPQSSRPSWMDPIDTPNQPRRAARPTKNARNEPEMPSWMYPDNASKSASSSRSQKPASRSQRSAPQPIEPPSWMRPPDVEASRSAGTPRPLRSKPANSSSHHSSEVPAPPAWAKPRDETAVAERQAKYQKMPIWLQPDS